MNQTERDKLVGDWLLHLADTVKAMWPTRNDHSLQGLKEWCRVVICDTEPPPKRNIPWFEFVECYIGTTWPIPHGLDLGRLVFCVTREIIHKRQMESLCITWIVRIPAKQNGAGRGAKPKYPIRVMSEDLLHAEVVRSLSTRLYQNPCPPHHRRGVYVDNTRDGDWKKIEGLTRANTIFGTLTTDKFIDPPTFKGERT